jgi:hypothetical protein
MLQFAIIAIEAITTSIGLWIAHAEEANAASMPAPAVCIFVRASQTMRAILFDFIRLFNGSHLTLKKAKSSEFLSDQLFNKINSIF